MSSCGLYLLSRGGHVSHVSAAFCCMYALILAGLVPIHWKRAGSGDVITVYQKLHTAPHSPYGRNDLVNNAGANYERCHPLHRAYCCGTNGHRSSCAATARARTSQNTGATMRACPSTFQNEADRGYTDAFPQVLAAYHEARLPDGVSRVFGISRLNWLKKARALPPLGRGPPAPMTLTRRTLVVLGGCGSPCAGGRARSSRSPWATGARRPASGCGSACRPPTAALLCFTDFWDAYARCSRRPSTRPRTRATGRRDERWNNIAARPVCAK